LLVRSSASTTTVVRRHLHWLLVVRVVIHGVVKVLLVLLLRKLTMRGHVVVLFQVGAATTVMSVLLGVVDLGGRILESGQTLRHRQPIEVLGGHVGDSTLIIPLNLMLTGGVGREVPGLQR